MRVPFLFCEVVSSPEAIPNHKPAEAAKAPAPYISEQLANLKPDAGPRPEPLQEPANTNPEFVPVPCNMRPDAGQSTKPLQEPANTSQRVIPVPPNMRQDAGQSTEALQETANTNPKVIPAPPTSKPLQEHACTRPNEPPAPVATEPLKEPACANSQTGQHYEGRCHASPPPVEDKRMRRSGSDSSASSPTCAVPLRAEPSAMPEPGQNINKAATHSPDHRLRAPKRSMKQEPVLEPPAQISDKAVESRLRRVFQPRTNGEFKVPLEVVQQYQDKDNMRPKLKAMFEKVGYSADRVAKQFRLCSRRSWYDMHSIKHTHP